MRGFAQKIEQIAVRHTDPGLDVDNRFDAVRIVNDDRVAVRICRSDYVVSNEDCLDLRNRKVILYAIQEDDVEGQIVMHEVGCAGENLGGTLKLGKAEMLGLRWRLPDGKTNWEKFEDFVGRFNLRGTRKIE
jgi:hypothetical protein